MRSLFLLLVLSIFSITGFSQKTITIKILQTSDVHGAIFPFDYINNRPMETSLAQVYSYVLQERGNNSQHVVLLDNGDILQGQPTVYYSNYLDTLNPNIISQVYNYMCYDAATLGNHDIEAGPRVYIKMAKEVSLPWLGANIINETTNEPAFQPYTIIYREGIKMAVLGLITPGVPNWLPKILWPDFRFEDMVLTAKKWVQIIKEKENPDILIGLFHSGHNASYGFGKTNEPLNENASLIVAQQVPGFDIVMIGHDHDNLCKKFANIDGDSVLVLDPGSSARFISEATISIVKDNKGTIKKKVIGKLVETKLYQPNQDFMIRFGAFSEKVEAFVNRKIGEFAESTSTIDAYFGPSSFVDFINSAQLSIGKADISFAAPLTFNTSINKGPVYIRDMFKLYKFENFLYTMSLTGEEVDRYLEHSYKLWLNNMKSAEDHLLRFKLLEDGSLDRRKDGRVQLASNYYNFDSALGINYVVDATKPAGDRVTIHSLSNGTAFEYSKKYKVAINSYRGNGGGGHLTEGCGIKQDELYKRIVFSTEKDLRFFILRLIENDKVITPKTENHWKIIPEDWVIMASERDRKLLFGKGNSE